MIFLLVLITLLRLLQVPVCGYIPARPSNATLQATRGASTASSLHLQWYANESGWEYVTRQVAASGPDAGNGPVEGILVHFTEDSTGDETTPTPWIAFVSCDANSPNSSHKADIFTKAKELGARSAVLYSLYSETCVIDPGHQAPALNVFATQTLSASRRIEYEFGQFGPSSGIYFNATMLNNAAGVVDDTLALHSPTAPGFLFATLSTYSATGTGLQADTNGTGISTNTSSGNAGVAMIVLYTITGCVSALFSAVIVSGAIRAIRHPERYGPRSADPTLGGGQSRAGGLGRAILDTFPIVKFRSSGNDPSRLAKDIESAPIDTESSAPAPLPNSVQLAQLSTTEERDPQEEGIVPSQEDDQPSDGVDQADLQSQGASRIRASPREMDARMPECIGRETCPICIVDFEEGDDLRVLPCEGKHQFHQSCVDPWLLELSGSCPICRQDFHALETIISGEPGNEASPANRHSEGGTSPTQNRFSRYLRFARRRQGRSVSMDQESPSPPES